MIPCSPILLIAAAQALTPGARIHDACSLDVTPRPVGRPRESAMEDPTGMTFVHQAGYWSHYDTRLGVSSWPLDPQWSLREVHAMAQRFELLQRDGDAGDLFIRCDATGTPASVGIVLARQGRLSLPGEEPTWECAALWGSSEALEGRWCRASRGDRYLPWYWMPHYRTFTPRRAA